MQGLISSFGRSYELIPCTKRGLFDSTLATITGADVIVASVLSNFICDSVAQAPDQLLTASNNELASFLQTLSRFSQVNPTTKIVVVPPLPRGDPQWFNAYLPCFTTFLIGEISRIACGQIRYLSPFVAPESFFDVDRIHLTQDAGFQFIQYIISGVDQVFPLSNASDVQSAPFVPPRLTSSGFSLPLTQPSTSATSVHSSSFAVEFGRITSALSTLTDLTSTMRSETKVRRDQDNLIFARLKEDRDFEFNKNREN